MRISTYFFGLSLLLTLGCQPGQERQDGSSEADPSINLPADFDLQGHRGCRGLMPENSIPAFRKALELGVNTLELDLVISGDSQVVVSHEPWLSHEICLDQEGREIVPERERAYNLFAMTYAEIRSYDCGTRPHPRFPQQENMPVAKPRFLAVVDSADAYARQLERPLPRYNVEIKRVPERDGIFHPEAATFVRLVLEAINKAGIEDRVTVQSFDVESLQLAQEQNPNLPLVLLVQNEESPQANLDRLGFVPSGYSPYFRLVDEDLVQFCRSQNMQLIPWTVNDSSDIDQMIALGVDGLITDYPNRVSQ